MNIKKINKLKTLSILPIIAISGGVMVDANNINESNNIENNLLKRVQFSEEVTKRLNMCVDKFNEYKNNKNIDTLKESIKLFSELPSHMNRSDINALDSENSIDEVFFNIRDAIYELPSKELNEALIYYGENIFLGWRLNKSVDVYGSKYLSRELSDYNKGKNNQCQPRLEYLKGLYNYFLKNVDTDYDSGVIPEIDINKPDKPSDSTVWDPTNPDYNFKPDGSDSGNSNQGGDVPDNNFSSIYNGSYIDYKKSNNKCYKVNISYKEGKEVSRAESLLPKSDFVKCGIYDYVHSNIKKPTGHNTSVDKDYLYEDQNLESKYSIYYTLNKKSSSPYYFDTGIKTSALDNSVSYNQLKDALYQLSIKADGFSVTDNDRSLAIIEGKPVVLKKQKDKYSKNEVERLLNAFSNVSFKIMESAGEKQHSLENMLVSGGLKTININGERIELSSSAILLNNTVLIPIQDLAVNLGATVSNDNKDTIIELGDKTIRVTESSLKYSEDGSSKKFTTAPVVKENSLFVELTPIATALGYDVSWDSDLGELNFKNK